MIPDRPSRTALGVARRRAAHQLLDDPLVLDDPFAVRIIGDEERRRLEARIGRTFPPSPDQHPASRALRAFVVARSRCAEEVLAAAVVAGIRQYLVLGAGLDTFAYRNPYPDLRVFEVDAPATQAWKRQSLAEAGITVPSGPAGVTFVPVDFERQELAGELAAAGLRVDEPVVVAWLGVTMYLTEASVWAVLGHLLGRPAGSVVVFDYALAPAAFSPTERLALAWMSDRVARAGEPWTAFFEPGPLADGLRILGARRVLDMDGPAINARWFAGRADGLHVGSLGRLVVAAT